MSCVTSLPAERFSPLPEGRFDCLRFLGSGYRRGDRLFIADLMTPDGEVYQFAKTVRRPRGAHVSLFPIIGLWRALGGAFYDMRNGQVPEEDEWSPFVGRAVSAAVTLHVGPSGRNYARVDFAAEIVR